MSFLMPKPQAQPIIINNSPASAGGEVPDPVNPPDPLGGMQPENSPQGPRPSQRRRQPSMLSNVATANRTPSPTFSGSPGTTPNFGAKTLLGT